MSMMSYNDLLDNFKEILKTNGLKYTKQRENVLRFLYEKKGHFTPEDIYLKLQQEYPNENIGIATVYRTLSLLEESNIASSISFGTQGKKYELGIKEHHDHLICSQCGRIIEFYDDTIEERQHYISEQHNFKMTNHTMKIIGICEKCQ
jgi:Fur family ferric uptake transcriptional regulator